MRKSSPIKIMVSEETKKKLKAKQQELSLPSLTALIEHIATHDIIFIDANTRKLLQVMSGVK